ncbi:aminoacyl-tRNA editing protein [Mucilaginibacter oryzae]|uniref:Aminoacyl-tRNA editing protein n=1 Tax=Mucilaginibacter oryzae TaxID=468058 RepID=A0A316GW93_9SPHI|nr:aminoacyl-tRNA editing protein [Mucilaginibacter oryzae]
MEFSVRKIVHHEVFDCRQASQARGIKLKQELKTLVLGIGERKIALHSRGCDRVNFRAVKNVFHIKNISFMSSEELLAYNLSKGLINPWNVEFCQYHLVCLKLFYNRFTGTNNSTATVGNLFLTNHIFQLPHLILGNFTHGNPNLPKSYRFDRGHDQDI